MRTVRITARAEEDLKGIWSYIAQDKPEAANKLIKEITSKFAFLRNYPQAGRQQDRLLVNLRSFAVKGYTIFYQPFEDRIEILRVMHGARDIESVFERFFDSL
jgi:toxin ParE1/3/4